MMPLKQPSIRISKDDLDDQDEDALDLFYSGIKSGETRRTMDQNLKRFLVEACHDILDGDYQQRAQQFVNIARKDQMKALRTVLAYARYLRDRALCDKTDPAYLNPSTIPNRIKPIKKLLDMNGIGLAWKRIQSTYPELDNIHKGRGYTREEIKTLLDFSKSLATDFSSLP